MFSLITPGEAQLPKLYDIVGHAFGLNAEDCAGWFTRAGLEHVRAMTSGDRVVGGLLEIPMAQFFGGRSVSMLGVAGVAVATAERGKGVAANMMIETLRGAKQRGFAISCLYPASVTLYRRAGYERAGARFSTKVDPRHVEIAREPTVTIEEVKTADGLPTELRAFYTNHARRTPGWLDRGEYVWNRVVRPRGLITKTFAAKRHGALEGYVVLAHTMGPGGFPTRVTVIDMVASTPFAARAILRLLIEYRSLTDVVKWEGSVNDVFANILPERHVDISLSDYFMIRIVDPVRAFEQRGYARGASGAVTFELTDESMPENSGRCAVTLENGNAKATAGGLAGPPVKLNERGLAALYSGFTQAHVLRAAGWLEADDDTCAMLDAWLAGPLPTMRDHF